MKRVILIIIFACAVLVGIILLGRSAREDQSSNIESNTSVREETPSSIPQSDISISVDAANAPVPAQERELNAEPDETTEAAATDAQSQDESSVPAIIVQVRGDASTIDLTPVELKQQWEKPLSISDRHAEIVEEFTDRDKELFRAKVSMKFPKNLVRSSGPKSGYPLATMGPVVIKAAPGTPVHLTALGLGQFVNGQSEITVRVDKSGKARVDFRLGMDFGAYSVLVKVPGFPDKELTYYCVSGKEG